MNKCGYCRKEIKEPKQFCDYKCYHKSKRWIRRKNFHRERILCNKKIKRLTVELQVTRSTQRAESINNQIEYLKQRVEQLEKILDEDVLEKNKGDDLIWKKKIKKKKNIKKK